MREYGSFTIIEGGFLQHGLQLHYTRALLGLVIAIILIIKKVQPVYCLILGALIGGIVGGGGLNTTVSTMVSGAASMMSSILRILTSGILTGALIKTGSAQKIAETIVEKLGEKRAVMAIAIATMLICAVGVFIDISVITVAPIALAIGEKAGLSRSGILLAMIGTGTIAGIIKASALQYDVTNLLAAMHMPAFILAPLAGILMAGATASTTAGATVAAQTFSSTLLSAGVSGLASAAMIHAGATVVDSLPHGSFFHATGGSVNMSISERMKLIPYEAAIGLTSTVVSVLLYLILG